MILFILAALTVACIMPWAVIYFYNEDCPQYAEDSDSDAD